LAAVQKLYNEDTQSNRSLYNFCTAANRIQQYDVSSGTSPVDEAFKILHSVSQGPMTKWSIVYDLTDMKIYFKVFETPMIVGEQKIFMKKPGEAEMKIIDFNELDFNCDKGSKVLDLNCDRKGNVIPYFMNYSTGINKEYIVKAFTFFKDWGAPVEINEEDLNNLAAYPESFSCLD
jgi:hypothetical protein